MDDVALVKMNGLFAGMYKPDIKDVRPSIAPEKLLRAGRSERQFVEQIQYSLLFCCFAVLLFRRLVHARTVRLGRVIKF